MIFDQLSNLICEIIQSDRDTNHYWFSTNKCNIFSNVKHFKMRMNQRIGNLTASILKEKLKRSLQEIKDLGYLDNVKEEFNVLVYFKQTDLCYVIAINPSTSYMTCDNEYPKNGLPQVIFITMIANKKRTPWKKEPTDVLHIVNECKQIFSNYKLIELDL